MTFERKTLAADCRFEGLGLHSGEPVTVTVRPSENGIVFRRGNSVWKAYPENVTDTSRCTRLGEISTVEHLMSAFAGLEITDADVELSSTELPALDGSAAEYCKGLLSTGFVALPAVEGNLPFTRVFVQEGDAKIAIGAGEGSWRYLFDSSDRWLGMQEFEVPNVVEEYVKEIAPARTFAFEEEMEMIRRAGLGKGLDESSAFVIGTQRYLNDTRFPDEPARHKLLDAIGDLYLAGIPIKHLNVVAERTGHKANVRAAMLLVQECSSAS